jgi:hypothetical protein
MYNAFLGQPALTKFMAIPHYTYLVLKMPRLCGVISIRGHIKRAYDCDKESYEMADKLVASVELQELKEALAKSPNKRDHARFQELQEIHPARGRTQQTDPVVYGGTFQGCSHMQFLGSQIGTHTRQIASGKWGHLCIETY